MSTAVLVLRKLSSCISLTEFLKAEILSEMGKKSRKNYIMKGIYFHNEELLHIYLSGIKDLISYP